MPTNYTGDETATEAPAAKPEFGVRPIFALPADGDPPNASTFEQWGKAGADYLAFLMVRGIMSGWLGDNSLGDVTQNVSTPAGGTLAGYRNLTLGAAGLLHFDTPGILRVSDTLNIAAGGVVRFGHPTNMNGANGDGAAITSAAGGIGWNSLSTGYVGGGGNGGAGGHDAHKAGFDGDPIGTARMGGAGGAGGAGGTAGGAAGTSTSFLTTYGSANVELLLSILKAGRASVRIAGTPPTTSEILLMGGAPGGGGGGPGSLAPPGSTGGGGGAGAGGCVGIVVARNVVVAADGAFFAPGGNGGNGSFGYGGAGSGGGGWLAIVCSNYDGPTLTAANCVPAGTAGTAAGGGTAGSTGSVGRLDLFPIGY